MKLGLNFGGLNLDLNLDVSHEEIGAVFGILLAVEQNDSKRQDILEMAKDVLRTTPVQVPVSEPIEHAERVEHNRATDRGEEAQPYEGPEHRGGEPEGTHARHEAGAAPSTS